MKKSFLNRVQSHWESESTTVTKSASSENSKGKTFSSWLVFLVAAAPLLSALCFTDADISHADFGPTRLRGRAGTFDSCNITLEQIKQTKNDKTGNMTDIKLPPEIQKALDEEKAK